MALHPQLSVPTFEHHPDGFGVYHARPRLSWRFSPCEDWQQSAYDVQILRRGAAESEVEVHHVESAESVLVPWPGAALKSREVATVRIRAYRSSGQGDGSRVMTEWSPPRERGSGAAGATGLGGGADHVDVEDLE